MRRTPAALLPTRNGAAPDPYEKPDRYSAASDPQSGLAGILERMTTAWMAQGKRSRYAKTGGILLFVLFILFYLAPNASNVRLNSESSKIAPIELTLVSQLLNLALGPKGQKASDPTTGTKMCARSSDPSKPVVQYVLMIDAGSTGSRIHVYRFNNCGSTPYLEDETFKMTEKKPAGSGLSSYGEDAEGAAKSLDILMDVAMSTVPDKLKACTPIAVKATAGLRRLDGNMGEKILDAVRTRLETVYPFPVVSKEHHGVEIMDGKDEGVYAWITTNYLLGKIGNSDHSPTAAVFDLGGGSTQIVFEPTFNTPSHAKPETLAEGDHKYNLSFGGRNFELYQHSHLGYGLMAARESIHKALVEGLHMASREDHSWTNAPVVNPCIAPGMTRAVEVKFDKDHALGESLSLNMTGPDVPSPALCRGMAEKILQKDKKCDLVPCSFNGVHQPSMAKTFSTEDIYIFSYFFDRTDPLGMPSSFTLEDMQHLTNRVCGGEASWDVFEGIPEALKELRGRPEWCLDLSFMMALLHTGYEMPIDREVKIANKINDNELGWCLGASLPLLGGGSGWQCRVTEVA